MQINRLFEIVHLLMNRKRTTAAELAERFEVSKRTILRDIDTLSAAGIPIYTTQGKGGGIFIHENFVLNKTLVSEDEQKQILFSLQTMSATEHIDTQQILLRLQNFFTSSATKDWIEVDFSRWGHSEKDNAKFEMLKRAIINECVVCFDYLSPYGESKELEVYPLKLSFKSKAWYLQSFCLVDNDYRVFKFTRINNITALEKNFNGSIYIVPSMKSVEEPTSTEYLHIKLRIAQNAKYRIYDEFAESDISVNDDGSFTLRTTLGQWIYDYILSYGVSVEVLEPQSVRDELLIRIEKMKNKYLSQT